MRRNSGIMIVVEILFASLLFGACTTADSKGNAMKDDKKLKDKLSDKSYGVYVEAGTEPPFQNEFWDNKREGIYVDILTGKPLFCSKDKFDSGSGWPSFTKPIEENNLATNRDSSFDMTRTEVKSADGGHLGHLFDDGPKEDGGMRYCINSASLRFVPAEDLDKEGYTEYKYLFDKGATEKKTENQKATFSAGCFWGVQGIIRKLPGVISTTVGYTGGTTDNPTYNDVKIGTTGHAEAIEIIFDPNIISYEELLGFFWRLHDPTQLDRQEGDIGTQYRSAIFYHDEKQLNAAKRSKDAFDASGVFKKKAATRLEKAGKFYPAEKDHQDYLQKYPAGYTCHRLRKK